MHATVHLGVRDAGRWPRFGAGIVNCANNFVICVKVTAGAMRTVVERMCGRLRLKLAKTGYVRVPVEPLDVRGSRVGRNYNRRTSATQIGTPHPGERVQCVPQGQCADGSAVRAGSCTEYGGTLEPSVAPLGDQPSPGAGEPTQPSTRTRSCSRTSGCVVSTR